MEDLLRVEAVGLDSVVKILSVTAARAWTLLLCVYLRTPASGELPACRQSIPPPADGGSSFPPLYQQRALSCKYTPAPVPRPSLCAPAVCSRLLQGPIGLPRHSTPNSAELSRAALSSSSQWPREESRIHRFSPSAGNCAGGKPGCGFTLCWGEQKNNFRISHICGHKRTFVLFFNPNHSFICSANLTEYLWCLRLITQFDFPRRWLERLTDERKNQSDDGTGSLWSFTPAVKKTSQCLICSSNTTSKQNFKTFRT